MRRIHWRATARTGTTLARRYEPVHERHVLLAVDLQTVPGPHWLMLFDDEQVEALCVTAASLARRLLGDGSACGLLVGAQLAGGGRWAHLAPSASPGQLGRIEDVLARLQPIVSLPFERLLSAVPRRVAPGGSLVVLGGRDPEPYLEPMRRLGRSGYDVTHVTVGPERDRHARRSAAAGIDARTADLAPSWKDADAIVLSA